MKKYFAIVAMFVLLFAQMSWASPSGLNNIPTADIVPEKVLVVQAYADVGENNKPDYFAGFKYGLLKNAEVGIDGRIFPESGLEETMKIQMKYRFDLGDKTGVALGVANLGDRAKLGWEDYYLVLSHDFGFVRAHFGGTLQRDNEGGFAGFDKTVPFLKRDLTLRTDVIQTNDSHDITTSAGFLFDLGHNVIFESWASMPTQSGKDVTATLKLNYVISF